MGKSNPDVTGAKQEGPILAICFGVLALPFFPASPHLSQPLILLDKNRTFELAQIDFLAGSPMALSP